MKYFLIVVSIVLSSFVFAQDEQYNINEETKNVTEQLDMWIVYNNDIKNVVVKFCNDWLVSEKLTSKLDLVIRPGQKKDVCVVFANTLNAPLSIVAKIVEWSIGENWNIVCSNDILLTWWDVFVSNLSGLDSNINLSAQEQLIKNFSISSLKYSSWMYYWCLAYHLDQTEKLSNNSMFNVVVRKAMTIRINVEWSPYRFQWFDNIISWINIYTRQIAIVWIILCGVLLVLSLLPSRKKTLEKKSTHKK